MSRAKVEKIDGTQRELIRMNAFKLDLMTLLAIFVILAVIVTMALGASDDDKISVGVFNSSTTNSAFASAIDSTSVNRTSQAVLPNSKFVSRSWQ
jgi:uncharacterized protein YpmS